MAIEGREEEASERSWMAPLVEYLQTGILPGEEAHARKLRRQKKFLLVAVDYFSKWVEAEPLARITEEAVLGFIWKNIVCRFGLPRKLVSDNGRQFQGKKIKDWCTEMMVKQVEEVPGVLWSYRTTPRTATGETPFSLVYGSEAVIPVEIGQISPRVRAHQEGETMDRTQELDLIKEKRERAAIRMEAYRSRIIKAFNQKVKTREFQIGYLVLKKVNPAGGVKKLEAKWEGPYKVIRRIGRSAWYLEDSRGKVLQRTWNTLHLKSYYP
ncbi:uncharacterized protein [Henckelia pumila]|uniref:uncharacterized protein n=1 Tax=Henckelia pumila TaxID=405737 RepID=UPI003C6DEBDE